MSACIIREYRGDDVPALKRLWQAVFGDTEELIDAFFALLPGMGTGVAAEADGLPCGMAFLIDGLSVSGRKVGYLYAVAVDPARRGQGLGAALSREAFRIGRLRGAEILCTQPAEPSLFDWYQKILGVECVLRRRTELLPCFPGLSPAILSAEDYTAKREALLSGQAHLCLSDHAMLFEKALCRSCGGDLYRIGDGLAAAYLDGDRAVIRELLLPEGSDRAATASSLGAALAAKDVLLCSADPNGEPYLAGIPGSIPVDLEWNLSFD